MQTNSLENEAVLVEAMQQGDEKAFTRLYGFYSPRLYINALKIVHDPDVAEEIVQELFTRIWQNRARPGIKENFSGYLYRTGQNLVRDFFRQLKRDRRKLARFQEKVAGPLAAGDDKLLRRESEAIFELAMQKLSPQQKKVYQLVKTEGLTYQKVAEILDISPTTVKEYLVAANKSILLYLSKHKDDLMLFLLLAAITDRIG